MLSEVLTSLVEVKARLEERLLQRPEYPALLIVDKAALQLSEVLTLLRPRPAELGANEAAGEPRRTAHAVRGEGSNADGLAAMATAASSYGASQEIPEDAPIGAIDVSRQVLADEVDAILSVPNGAPVPAPRTYLPFFVARRRPQYSRF